MKFMKVLVLVLKQPDCLQNKIGRGFKLDKSHAFLQIGIF